jgi:cell wall-associated NlpC family hydrolase
VPKHARTSLRAITTTRIAVAGGLALSGVAATAPSAAAAPARTTGLSNSVSFVGRAHAVAQLAAAQRGKPYVYGASGPRAFDCSGLITYVYARAGIQLPHNAAAQARMSRRVGSPVPGDLVFFWSGNTSNVYHVGVYAGYGAMYSAPHSGSNVKLQPIWSRQVYFGRMM